MRFQPREDPEPLVVPVRPQALQVDELNAPLRRPGPGQRPVILEVLLLHPLHQLCPGHLATATTPPGDRQDPRVGSHHPLKELLLLVGRDPLHEHPLTGGQAMDVPVANGIGSRDMAGNLVAISDVADAMRGPPLCLLISGPNGRQSSPESTSRRR